MAGRGAAENKGLIGLSADSGFLMGGRGPMADSGFLMPKGQDLSCAV
jgi:hypothetical protein